jgi:hypothetical protein
MKVISRFDDTRPLARLLFFIFYRDRKNPFCPRTSSVSEIYLTLPLEVSQEKTKVLRGILAGSSSLWKMQKRKKNKYDQGRLRRILQQGGKS